MMISRENDLNQHDDGSIDTNCQQNYTFFGLPRHEEVDIKEDKGQ